MSEHWLTAGLVPTTAPIEAPASPVREALVERILLVLGLWDDAALAYLADELEAGGIAPPPPEVVGSPEDCKGEGTCHGATTTCPLCGDVSEVCDQDEDDCPHHEYDEDEEAASGGES
jgi:hypothetical protein